jgi:hypothetical protein
VLLGPPDESAVVVDAMLLNRGRRTSIIPLGAPPPLEGANARVAREATPSVNEESDMDRDLMLLLAVVSM